MSKKLNTTAVVRGMERVEAALAGHSPEEIGALVFCLVEKAVAAGMTEADVIREIETVFATRREAAREILN